MYFSHIQRSISQGSEYFLIKLTSSVNRSIAAVSVDALWSHGVPFIHWLYIAFTDGAETNGSIFFCVKAPLVTRYVGGAASVTGGSTEGYGRGPLNGPKKW